MDWYFKELFRDKRFKIAACVAGGSIVAIVICALLGAKWSYTVAAFALFPVLMLAIIAVFVVLGIIVRNDYLERKGHR